MGTNDQGVREALKKFRKEIIAHHKESKKDPIYSEGYAAPHGKNPYLYPRQLDLERTRISIRTGQLTSEEMQLLQELNKEFEHTKWQRWARGNDYRWSVESGLI